jgi:hypothetical protein
MGPIAHVGIQQNRALVIDNRIIGGLSLEQRHFEYGGCGRTPIRGQGPQNRGRGRRNGEEGDGWRRVKNLTGMRDPRGIRTPDTNVPRETSCDGAW